MAGRGAVQRGLEGKRGEEERTRARGEVPAWEGGGLAAEIQRSERGWGRRGDM